MNQHEIPKARLPQIRIARFARGDHAYRWKHCSNGSEQSGVSYSFIITLLAALLLMTACAEVPMSIVNPVRIRMKSGVSTRGMLLSVRDSTLVLDTDSEMSDYQPLWGPPAMPDTIGLRSVPQSMIESVFEDRGSKVLLAASIGALPGMLGGLGLYNLIEVPKFGKNEDTKGIFPGGLFGESGSDLTTFLLYLFGGALAGSVTGIVIGSELSGEKLVYARNATEVALRDMAILIEHAIFQEEEPAMLRRYRPAQAEDHE